MEFLALLDAKEPEKLDLRQDDVVWQRAYQAEIEDLLGRGQRLLRVKGPGSVSGITSESCLEDNQKANEYDNKDDKRDG